MDEIAGPKMGEEVIRVFSAEQQATIIRDQTGIVLPILTGGRKRFFSDLVGDRGTSADEVGCVLPEPQFGLVFSTVGEVLASSFDGSQASAGAWISEKLTEFGLSPSKATQPVKSLSGGERMLLTFAKLHAMNARLTKLVACSPLHSLDQSRYHFWYKLSETFVQNGKAVKVILLEGEELLGTVDKQNIGSVSTKLPWHLLIESPTLKFPEAQFPSFHPAFNQSYMADTNILSLASPDNGIGKSALCKALAGLAKIVRGSVGVVTPNGSGPARLMLQEADEQLFGKSITEHLQSAFRYDAEGCKVAQTIYDEIDRKLREFVKDTLVFAPSLGDPAKPSTELQTKIVLAAERIASKPSLLILDEPSRKLCKPLAVRLVASICEQAHKHNVPVLIISHAKDWWTGIAQSRLIFKQLESGLTKVEKGPEED
jgi:energy-coupling factor transporter ATP-binding protein EcfA2